MYLRHTPTGRAARLMLTLALCAGWTVAGEAAPVTFTFTGEVTQINRTGEPYSGPIAVGNAIEGHFTFESAAPDLIPDTAAGLFTSPLGAPYGLSVTIGGASTFSTSGYLGINVYNDPDGLMDSFGVMGCPGTVCGSMLVALSYKDSSGTVFGGDSLPATPPPFGAFDSTLFWLYAPNIIDGNYVDVIGSLSSLACSAGCEPASTPVPEPGTLGMVGLAVSTLIGRGARSRRRNQA
jgi:hypothetical protein